MTTQTKTAVGTFTFDTVEELCEDLFIESEEKSSARITYENRILILTTINFQDAEVKVFRVEESEALYKQMDEIYVRTLEENTSGSDFWDQWFSVMEAFEPYKIVDETMNP